MSHTSDAVPHPSAPEEDAVVGGAWIGPALGSAVLTIAWAAYLVPLLLAIFSVG
jgi:hypothetical protein